jgi:hypothetical protein
MSTKPTPDGFMWRYGVTKLTDHPCEVRFRDFSDDVDGGGWEECEMSHVYYYGQDLQYIGAILSVALILEVFCQVRRFTLGEAGRAETCIGFLFIFDEFPEDAIPLFTQLIFLLSHLCAVVVATTVTIVPCRVDQCKNLVFIFMSLIKITTASKTIYEMYTGGRLIHLFTEKDGGTGYVEKNGGDGEDGKLPFEDGNNTNDNTNDNENKDKDQEIRL